MPLFIADWAFQGREGSSELSFAAGAKVKVLELNEASDWWSGILIDKLGNPVGPEGYFPKKYGHLGSVQETPYSGLTSRERGVKRNDVMIAVLRAEREFIKTTSVFLDAFVRPILRVDTQFKRRILAADSSLALLLQLYSEMNESSQMLFNGVTASTSGESLAQVYKQFAASLPLYAQYTTEIPRGLNVLRIFSEGVNDFLSKMPSPGLAQSVESYLLEPLEHYVRYLVDFQEFVWLSNDRELPALQAALALMTEMACQVDSRTDAAEASIKLLDLQSQFIGQQPIFAPERRLVKFGELEKVRESTGSSGERKLTTKKYAVHLFNDVFMYSVSSGNVYKLHKMVPLLAASVRGSSKFSSRVSNTFALTSAPNLDSGKTKVDIFRSNSADESAAWVQAIERETQKLARAAAAASSSSSAGKGSTRTNLPGVTFADLGPRAACIFTFLDREIDFVNAILRISQVLLKPLLLASTGQPLAVKKSAALLSSSSSSSATSQHDILIDTQTADVQLFLNAAEALVAGLQEFQRACQGACLAARWSDANIAIGALFCNPRSRNVYTHFKAFGSKQLQFLRTLHRPYFLSFYRDVEATLGGNSLAEKLEALRNHPATYAAFLQSLLKLTPTTHADYPALAEASTLISDLITSMNESIRGRKNFEKVVDIQNSLVSNKMFGADDPIIEQLATPDRVFIKEGDLKKVCQHKNKPYRFWLFNDLLIYGAAIGSGSYTFHYALNLGQCTFSAVPSSVSDQRSAFEVVGCGKAFIVIAPSEQAKEDWLEKIASAKSLLVAKSTPGTTPVEHPASIAVVNASDRCGICSQSFSLFRRRHTCRSCGKSVCGEHSKKGDSRRRTCLGCLVATETEAKPTASKETPASTPSGPARETMAEELLVGKVPFVPRTTGPTRKAPPPPVVPPTPIATTLPISYKRASIVIADPLPQSEESDMVEVRVRSVRTVPAPPRPPPQQSPLFPATQEPAVDADLQPAVDETYSGEDQYDQPASAATITASKSNSPPPPPPPSKPPLVSPLSPNLLTSINRLQLEPMELRKAKARFSCRPPLGGKSSMMFDLIKRMDMHRSKIEGSDDDSESDSDSDFD